jgi:2-polyprenyl-3-methyl-5-hydroxy-6-metoxy-1,4-benzoquinol methylase
VVGLYGARLKADGVTDAAIKERLAVIVAEAPRRRLDLTAVHFDRIYADPKPPFRTEASEYLLRTVTGRSAGTALDVGMGQGRNALYLASRGWRVTGYDISEGGLAAARAQAEARKLSIATVRATHADFDFGVERWDLIVMTYAFTPMDDDGFLRRVRDSLKPGGIVVVEQFNAAPDKATNKGPANALLKSFDGLRVIHYEDTVGRSEWGSALCRIGRITAEKDSAPPPR